MTSSPLPLEIWWLVCQELVRDAPPDFNSLFSCALVDRAMAKVALPPLYSVHHKALVNLDASIAGQVRWANLWRSLILSSIGKTAFPYALWIRKLQLGDLQLTLQDIARNPAVREDLFKGDMAEFEMVSNVNMTRAVQRKLGRVPLAYDAIALKVGDAITSFVKDAADRNDKVVTLAKLESHRIPTDVLITWTSRLSTLRSLTLREVDSLNADVASAIRRDCPSFAKLRCLTGPGDNADGDMAAFLFGLAPQTLEHFEVISYNNFGQQTFAALAFHSKSLKNIMLASISQEAVPALSFLCECTAIETLRLEYESRAIPYPWKDDHKESYLQVAEWLRNSQGLTSLDIGALPDTPSLLAKVLPSKNLRLRSLRVHISEHTRQDSEFYPSLSHQETLEELFIEDYEDSFGPSEALVQAVSECRNLVALYAVNSQFTAFDLRQLCLTLPRLEILQFDGEHQDSTLDALMGFERLKYVTVNGTSSFSFDRLRSFIEGLSVKGSKPAESTSANGSATISKGPHYGFSLIIASQIGFGSTKFTKAQETSLQDLIKERVNGELSLTYIQDEDELHESDFSD
ncbi:hypothetical protein MCOR25_003412 [Pyricularia grisea]|uniref:F-box domain-containing protein n=1 Tax=Pyricularia grisea TaxID=148305 RepID=A0A6P8ART1_PYRGI|nr:uncharacterized protein PgNI_09417 [Pyricularia grisea]KAI6373639.1 hypothetical protein MCOR25_003412 [Pyricularia grisea]TLD04802.1 hypothetical protein PgNI_09417 [Pyricularia grisea]